MHSDQDRQYSGFHIYSTTGALWHIDRFLTVKELSSSFPRAFNTIQYNTVQAWDIIDTSDKAVADGFFSNVVIFQLSLIAKSKTEYG